jgi:chromosome segregation ATPase
MSDPVDSLMLSILKEIRSEQRDHRTLLLQLAKGSRRHDRRFNDIERRFNDIERRFADIEHRIGDLSGEFELTPKSELMGRLTHFETQIDEKLARLSDRLDAADGARP